MKKETITKYPHSACLFQFCRKVLDHKFGGIRVIDQDVGQILGFDPADCSHWKKGKKNIRSIQAVKSIADHLGVDEKLIFEIASGEINETEAFYEYSGYGRFFIDEDLVETAKKEFYLKNANVWTRDRESAFRNFFDLQENRIDDVVSMIHKKVDFNEAPLYLPEIAANFPNINLRPTNETSSTPITASIEGSCTNIHFPANEKMRPYIRYQIAKAMAGPFFREAGISTPDELGDYAQHVKDIQANLFVAKLLTPANLIRKELSNVNIAKDIIGQLAEIFWVSKTFMNARLKDVLEKTPII